MKRVERIPDNPAKGVWWRFLVLVPLLVVLVIACRAHIHAVGSTYVAYGPIPIDGKPASTENVTLSPEGVVEVADVGTTNVGNVRIVFRSLADGETVASVGGGRSPNLWYLRVEDGTILDGGIDFSGWESIHISICVFLAVLAALFASVLVRLWRRSWYGYVMVACGGGLLFSLVQFILFFAYYVRGSLRGFSDLAFEITEMADYFVYLSFIPMGIAALLVCASNISLIRHEGLRPINLLGIAASIVWAAVNFFFFASAGIVFEAFGSFEAAEIVDVLLAVAISYGECLLVSTILCAWLASRHEPAHGVDYLIVLGCGLRPDGTPCPLLAGRVDRALAFDVRRIGMGDAPATFVPSGGQGPDEIMSEAQSMSDYLVGKGVERARVVLESRSSTTRQNMAFSRAVIENHASRDASELKVAFSTTNYHVFRGYVCAHLAGMAVEGMGSKTRAYFWPNAFLREFAGLLAAQWKSIVLVYAALAVVYGAAAYALIFA